MASYFQGGDFVELLSAQGKAPAANWKLQGKIAKSFDKGIKGNAFLLDGGSETKMQLPKTAAATASLGLAQRFLVLQLLVPFTRSFSVEIGFADFQKVRRRFVVASAFRETARTALHVQLPLNSGAVPRDRWLSLVFDLQTLAETHFPDSAFRSMESLCIAGSCRLKRVFTMKDAPTPSPGSRSARHATVRDLPRQFVFSASRRGGDMVRSSVPSPIPTVYFAMPTATEGVASDGVLSVTGTRSSEIRQPVARRGQTAPIKTTAKSQSAARGTKGTARPASGPRGSTVSSTADKSGDGEASALGRQRLRTPTPVSTVKQTGDRIPSVSARVAMKVQDQKRIEVASVFPESRVDSGRDRIQELQARATSPADISNDSGLADTAKNWTPRAGEPKEDELGDVEPPLSAIPDEEVHLDAEQELTEVTTRGSRQVTSTKSVSSSHSNSPKRQTSGDAGTGDQRVLHRQEIVGEIQRQLTMLEDDDERASARDRELFLRHTSLNSGEWHLKTPPGESEELEDATLFSDGECETETRLSQVWRQELDETGEASLSPSPRVKPQPRSRQDDSRSIFSFSRSLATGSTSIQSSGQDDKRTSSSRLFDFDSLLLDVDQHTRSSTGGVPGDGARADAFASHSSFDSPLRDEKSAGVGDRSDSDEEDLELLKMLEAKRSARLNPFQPKVLASSQKGEGQSVEGEAAGDSDREDDGEDLVASREQLYSQTGEVPMAQEEHDDVGAYGSLEARDDSVHHEDSARKSMEAEEKATMHSSQDTHHHEVEGSAGDAEGSQDDELSMDLTSDLDALSVNGEEDLDAFEDSCVKSAVATSTRPSSSVQRSSDPETNDDSDVGSSFDFEDLVDELSDDGDEGQVSRTKTSTTLDTKPQRALPPPVPRRKQSSSLETRSTVGVRSVPRSNQQDHDLHERSNQTNLGLAKARTPATSPPMRPPRGSKDRNSSTQTLSKRAGGSAEPHSVGLSTSFSSHRLQKLLESTDWTAELTAHARAISSPSTTSSGRSREVLRKSSRSRESLASCTQSGASQNSRARRSSRCSSPASVSPRPSSSSTSTSLELLYDPLLRCYFDPVANKYYALAE